MDQAEVSENGKFVSSYRWKGQLDWVLSRISNLLFPYRGFRLCWSSSAYRLQPVRHYLERSCLMHVCFNCNLSKFYLRVLRKFFPYPNSGTYIEVYLFQFLSKKCFSSHTVRTGIIGPDSRTLELPLLVWSGYFFFFICLELGLKRPLFAVRSPPYPREGISNVLARGPILPVSTVVYLEYSASLFAFYDMLCSLCSAVKSSTIRQIVYRKELLWWSPTVC